MRNLLGKMKPTAWLISGAAMLLGGFLLAVVSLFFLSYGLISSDGGQATQAFYVHWPTMVPALLLMLLGVALFVFTGRERRPT